MSQDYLSRLNHFRCKATYSRKNDSMSGSLQEKLKGVSTFSRDAGQKQVVDILIVIMIIMVIDANNENGINNDTDIHGSHDTNMLLLKSSGCIPLFKDSV